MGRLEGAKCLVVHPGAELYGSDRVLLESVVALIEAGMQVSVLVPSDGPLVPVLRDAGAAVSVTPLLVLRKSLLKPTGWLRLVGGSVRDTVTAWRTITRLRPDAIFVNTVTIPIWPVVARIRRRPALTHVHEAERAAAMWIKRLLYAPLLAARDIIVNSEYSRQVIADVYPRTAARSAIVYNGVVGPADPMPPRAELDGPIRVVYVGRLSPRKGPDLLVLAAQQLAREGVEVDVDLVGAVFPGYEWFEGDLQKAASTRPGSVRLHGFNEDVWPFLAAADVAVVPSRIDEPFGNTAVEAVLAARPVVVSDTSGLREAVSGVDSALTVTPDDAEAIAAGLRAIAEGWTHYRERAVVNAPEAARRFAPAAYRQAVAERIANLIGAPPAAPERGPANRVEGSK